MLSFKFIVIIKMYLMIFVVGLINVCFVGVFSIMDMYDISVIMIIIYFRYVCDVRYLWSCVIVIMWLCDVCFVYFGGMM